MLGQVLALRQLRVLVVRSQSLARLTAGIAGLALLRRLDLSANAKLEIDADVPLSALWELRSLDLSAPAGLCGYNCMDICVMRSQGGMLGGLWLCLVCCPD